MGKLIRHNGAALVVLQVGREFGGRREIGVSWGIGKKLCSIELGVINSGMTESDMIGIGKEPLSTEPSGMDSGMTESYMTGREVSDTWVGVEVEDGTCNEDVIGSENIGSCGKATLGQIWEREIEVCGEWTEVMKGKTVS